MAGDAPLPVATVVLEVELAPGQVGKLAIRAADDPQALAQRFVAEHGLGPDVEGPLALYVTRQQMCMTQGALPQPVKQPRRARSPGTQTPEKPAYQRPTTSSQEKVRAAQRSPGKSAAGRPAWRPVAQPEPSIPSAAAEGRGPVMRVAGSSGVTDLAKKLQRRTSEADLDRSGLCSGPGPFAGTPPSPARAVASPPTRSSELRRERAAATRSQSAMVASELDRRSPPRRRIQPVLLWDQAASESAASAPRSSGRPPTRPAGFFLHQGAGRSASSVDGSRRCVRAGRTPPRYAVSPTRSTALKQQHACRVDWAASERSGLPRPLDSVAYPRQSDQELFDASFAAVRESSSREVVSCVQPAPEEDSFGERLYRRAVQTREHKARLQEEYKRRNEEREWEEVVGHRWSKSKGRPFHPCITDLGASIKHKLPVHVMRRRRPVSVGTEDDEMSECTFRPNLPSARRPSSGRVASPSPNASGHSVFDQLHYDADLRSSKRRFAEEHELSRLRTASPTARHPHARTRPLVVVEGGGRNVFARLAPDATPQNPSTRRTASPRPFV
eukprot:TRINITY_DN18184_c0_g1_i1.p1 TRINITY_DN18184_c0_g1~~TRINITY_DN18184_c0_g1_i1.p1  ORF type:complete len:584 (+),score=114.68 TRINITY_DN18184_c0_g1_i1:82-1752(+)